METMLFNAVVDYLLPLLVIGLIALIGLGCAYLQKSITNLKNEGTRKFLSSAIDEAQKWITGSINNVRQTYTDAIKAASVDGKLTPEEQSQALQKAKAYFISHISSDALAALKDEFAQFDQWIEGWIEAELGVSKQAATAQSGSPAASATTPTTAA